MTTVTMLNILITSEHTHILGGNYVLICGFMSSGRGVCTTFNGVFEGWGEQWGLEKM